MEKIIDKPTYITIKDKDGKEVLGKSLLDKDTKVVYDEEKKFIDIFNSKGERIWHTSVTQQLQIIYDDDNGGSD